MSLRVCLAKTFARYRGHLGPLGPKLEKESENDFPGPLGPGAPRPRGPKSRNRIRKRVKIDCFLTILPLFRLRFRLFWAWGQEAPGTHFPTLFLTLGPEGPNDPCSRARESQCLSLFCPTFLSVKHLCAFVLHTCLKLTKTD